jgi:hypothetical protein
LYRSNLGISANEDESSGSSTPDRFSLWNDCAKCCPSKVTYPELKSSLFLKAPSVFRNGQFSPDGKWVAYASNETGKWEIYVTSFPDARVRWQISSGGGEQPRWRGDGKELFYLSLDGKMMAAPVTTGAHFDAGTSVTLFQTTPVSPSWCMTCSSTT